MQQCKRCCGRRGFPHISKATKHCVIAWCDSEPEVGILAKSGSGRNCNRYLVLSAEDRKRIGSIESIDTSRQVVFVGSAIDAYSYHSHHKDDRLK